jgi:DMSO/TMAO reductase YedYZ heme-binding membrane subunit
MTAKTTEGWPLVGWTALGVAALVAGLLGAYGVGSAGLSISIRLTARVAVVLFMAAFAASSAHRVRRSPFTAWLLRNRRYLGVSFAVVHFTHLGLIVASAAQSPAEFLHRTRTVTIVFGGLAYLLLLGMTATSFDRTAAWLGRMWWKRLHLAGSYLVWGVFLQSYTWRAVREPVLFGPFAVALVLVLPLRLGIRWPLFRFESSIVVDRAPGDVYKVLIDFPNVPSWEQGPVEVRQVSPGAPRVGTELVCRRIYAGCETLVACRITAWDDQEGVTMSIRGGPLRDASVRYAVEPASNGRTLVTYTAEGRLRPALVFLTPFMPALGRAEAKKSLASLKRLLEAAGHDEPARPARK